MPSVLQPGWVGRRVSVRRVVDREPDGRLLLADVVGDLVGLDAQTAVLDARDGYVEVPVALVTAARVAMPSTADELALEAIAARGLRAAHTAQLGGWLLRADVGSPRRANSVLPLRAPGMPLADALQAAHDWYAEHGLPLLLGVPTEARRLLDAELGERGWPVGVEAHVMAARLDVLGDAPDARPVRLDDAPDARPVRLDDAPDEAWLACYGAEDPAAARALLTRHDRVVFATVDDAAGGALAIGRGVVDDGWLGIFAVQVRPEARRRGLAQAIMRALWAWGRDQGATRSYLQVEVDNHAAIALYERLGYWVHHDYRYRSEPE